MRLSHAVWLSVLLWGPWPCDGQGQAPRIPAPQRTVVIKYVPQVPREEREGSCWTNSLSVQRSDAWRCMVKNEIFDPCYLAVDRKTIVCDADPRTKDPCGFKLRLTEPLPDPEAPANARPSTAFMIELADGTLCTFVYGAGAGAEIDGTIERVNYHCEGSEEVIFGDLQPGEVWTATRGLLVRQKAPKENGPPFAAENVRKVAIRIVWQ